MPTVLSESNLPGLDLIHRGKVRDVYALGVEELLIYADNDANRAGQRAAAECAGLWREEGILVTIVTPDRKGSDFADVYRRPA